MGMDPVDTEGNVGGGSSLALEPGPPYTPHISYGGNSKLKYAWLSGTTWISETVDDSAEIVGHDTSLALESTSPYTPHISYVDVTSANLKYAWLNSNVWISETIDSEGAVGWWPSLTLDDKGNPYISYYDATNGDLKYAYIPPIEVFLPVVMKDYSPP